MKVILMSIVMAVVSIAAQAQAQADANTVVCTFLVYDSQKGLIWPISGDTEQTFAIPPVDNFSGEHTVKTPTGIEFKVRIFNLPGVGPAILGSSGIRFGQIMAEAGITGYKSAHGLNAIALEPKLTVPNGKTNLMGQMSCFFR